MDSLLANALSLKEGVLPLSSPLLLRARHFTPAALRRGVVAGLRSPLDRSRIATATDATSVLFRDLLVNEIFFSLRTGFSPCSR